MKNKILSALILFTFFFFSLGQLGRISFSGQEVNLYFYELLIVVSLAVIFYRYRFQPIILAYKNYRYIFWFLSVLVISYCFNLLAYKPVQNLVSFLYFVRLILYIGYAIYLGYLLKKDKKYVSVIRYGLLLFGVTTMILSAAQYIFYPDLRILFYLGWDSHFHRLFGVFLDTSIAAAIYGMFFIFILRFDRLIHHKIVRYFVLAVFGLFLIMTFSRSAYIGFLITLFYFLWKKKKVMLIFIGLLVFVGLLVIVPKRFGNGVGLNRTFSIDARIVDINDGITMWLKNPILGIGYNRIRYAREKYHIFPRTLPQDFASHAGASFSSSYIIMMVCGGIVGLIFFVASLVQLTWKNPHAQLLLIFIGLLSLTDNILLHPFVLFLMATVYVLGLNYPSDKSR